MILPDHNIPEDQAAQLRRWRIHVRQIGFDVGRPEWGDQQEVLRYLHAVKRPTLCTRDVGFFRRRLCHPNYCLVILSVPALESAFYVRRVIRHPRFGTSSKRPGKVMKVSSDKIAVWTSGQERVINFAWEEG